MNPSEEKGPTKKPTKRRSPCRDEGPASRPEEKIASRLKPEPSEIPIVGIGASAGGLDALKELFGAVPADSGLAFLVVQHLDPVHESQLPTILARHSSLRVLQAEKGQTIEPNTVYIIPPGYFMGLERGRLQLVSPVSELSPRMSVDFLFRSLAEELKDKAICVILSGSASDGTLGLRAVRGAGGLAIVQDPDTAQFDSMPRSAIATGLADFILPPPAIVPTLLDYVRHAYSRRAVAEEELSGDPDDSFNEILRFLLKGNADFRGYKTGTLLRRIRRRMGLNQINNLGEYAQFLRRHSDEVAKLNKDILISVTAFFRDPRAYEELKELFIVPLVRSLPEGQPVRVWVAGCATGEEAYSVALLVLEELQAAHKTNPLQVFASDLDDEALAFARAGVYPESIMTDVSPERLKNFFTKQDHSYRVRKELRDTIVFSSHNVVADPPFTRMDLISCRNVLIYLGASLQQRLISLLSFALKTEGVLFLGPAETPGESNELFEAMSKKWRIYRRTAVPRHEMMDFPLTPRLAPPTAAPDFTSRVPLTANVAIFAQQALVKHFAAALVLIDAKGHLLYFQGDTEKFLRHPTGGPDLNLFTMAREQLPRRLRAAVRQALVKNETVKIEKVPLAPGEGCWVNITVEPISEPLPGERLLAVIFEDAQSAASARAALPDVSDLSETGKAVEQLEAELRAAREEALLIATEHSAATEELRAAHEEAVSMNEELRSTNEELETSKEELQSVNEELATLNLELKDKINSLNEVNSDLANLINGTEIATVFLDRELRIRRFTPAATQLLNLIPSDVGRPLSHISARFVDGELASKAAQVLRDLRVIQEEVRTPENRCYLMRALPYRDISDRIDGVVITFTDTTAVKQARLYAEQIVATAREPLVVLDRELRVVSVNPAFYRVFELQTEQVEGVRLPEINQGWWNLPPLIKKLGEAFSSGQGFEGLEVETELLEAGRRVMVLNGTPMASEPALVLLAMENITDERLRRRAEEAMTLEVSHRTKNGLAIISGLLEMQAQHPYLEETGKEMIRTAITRIKSFGALYEQIQTAHREDIELRDALQRIAEITHDTLAPGAIDLSVEGAPAYYDFAVATNLIVVGGELIINAIKYGAPQLPEGRRKIRIKLEKTPDKLILSIWNSGVPVSEDFNIAKQAGTGLHLVKSVVEEIYGGQFSLAARKDGNIATIILPEKKLKMKE